MPFLSVLEPVLSSSQCDGNRCSCPPHPNTTDAATPQWRPQVQTRQAPLESWVQLRPHCPLRRRVPGRPAPQRTYRHEPPRGCLTLQGGWQGWAWFAWGHPISDRVKGREWTWGLQGSLSHCLPTVPALWPLAGLGHSPLPTPPSQKPSTQADSTRNGLLNRPCTFHISLIMPFPSMQLPFLSGGARVLAALPGSEQIPLPTKCPASPQHREPLRSRTLTILLHPPVGH